MKLQITVHLPQLSGGTCAAELLCDAAPTAPAPTLSPALAAEIAAAQQQQRATDLCTCGHPRGAHTRANKCLGTHNCPCPGFKAAPADTSRPQATRGTLQGLLDRLDDALERGDQAAAQGASRELRNALDQVPL